MCMNCGCGDHDDEMGNPKNITNKTIDDAAQASGMSRKQTLRELKKAIDKELEQEDQA